MSRTDSKGRHHSPRVWAAADRAGLDLATVAGSGAAGRVRVEDVRAAAPPTHVPYRQPQAVTTAPASSGRQTRAAHFGPPGTWIELDVFGPNPLVEDARLSTPSNYAAAMRESAPPTLFGSGDLPPFTASGIDPKELRRLPWFARHWAAASTDRSAILAAFEDFAQPGGDMDLGGTSHSGAQEYESRVSRWLSGMNAPVQYGS